MNRDIIIRAVKQISIQPPLSEDWMNAPLRYDGREMAVSVDPDFRRWVSPLQSRRMGHLMKRSVAVSSEALSEAQVKVPDAIIAATGLGCIESTEAFLNGLCIGENLLKPTSFMHSTHNTVAAALAIRFGCHGYNTTYSHGSISFESALYDACLQLGCGRIGTALVGGFDEITPSYHVLLRKLGFVRDGGPVCSEAAVAFVLSASDCPAKGLCRISKVGILHRPGLSRLREEADIFLGTGNVDAVVAEREPFVSGLFPDVPVIGYKDIFGECYTVSALGVYAAASWLAAGRFRRGVLFFNRTAEDDCSFVLLERICGK